MRSQHQRHRLREPEGRKPRERMGRLGRRRHQHPGLHDRHQRGPGRPGAVQGQHRRQQLPAGHLSHGVLQRARRAEGRDGAAVRGAAADPARMPHASRHRIDRLRQLGAVRVMGGAGRRRVGHLFRQGRAPRQRRRQSHLLRRARRRWAIGPPVPDVGHDVAGIQHLRRQQPLRGCPRRARVQGELQPPDDGPQRFERRPTELRLQRRVPDGALARSQRLSTSATPPASTPTAAAPSCSSTRYSCPSATTNTGRARSARTSRTHVPPA